MVRLNLGSGHWKLEGWINVDLDRDSNPDVCADLSALLPFRSGIADLIHTEDFVDRLELAKAELFLRECHRILKPGGVMRVLTPDLEKLTSLYLHDPDRLLYLWTEFVGVPLKLGTAAEVINQAMHTEGHAFLYDGKSFTRLLALCGFEARRVAYQSSQIPALCGIDLRSPDVAVSMYFDCYRMDA